jgi:hypothetical protein
MSRDQRLLMLMHGGASSWERLSAWCDLAFSSSARATYRRYAGVSAVLHASLADRDDLIAIKFPHRRTMPAKTGAWLLIGGLFLIAFFEWRNYTIPALMDAVHSIMHRCGL